MKHVIKIEVLENLPKTKPLNTTDNRNLCAEGQAPGYRLCFGINNVDSYCDLWSSSINLDNPNSAYYLDFNSNNILMDYDYRYIGYSVCPV